jgi:hypothetical protein
MELLTQITNYPINLGRKGGTNKQNEKKQKHTLKASAETKWKARSGIDFFRVDFFLALPAAVQCVNKTKPTY